MAKKGIELIAVGAIFLLFLAGCKGGDTTSGSLTTPFLGGEGGVDIKFLEGNPPAEVTDDNTFPFQAIVSLKNVGEHDIEANQMKVNIVGFLPSQFKSKIPGEEFADTDLDKKLATALTGKKKDADGNILEPVETFLAFPTDTKNFKFSSQVQGNTIFIFRADACYAYKTKAISELCVLQNQIDKAPDAICNPTEPKTIFSSGSPIKVTSFRENIAGKDKLQLSFDVVHSGPGDVFSDSVLTPASKASVDTAINKINEALIEVKIQAKKTGSFDRALSRTKITEAKAALDSITQKLQSVTDAIAKLTGVLNSLDADEKAKFEAAIAPLEQAKKLLIDEISDCPKDPTQRRAKEDQISVTVDTGLSPKGTGNYILKCVGLSDVVEATTAKQSGKIRLVNGKRTITCTLDLPAARTDFKKPVDISVNFNYAQSVDKNVLVKHLIS